MTISGYFWDGSNDQGEAQGAGHPTDAWAAIKEEHSLPTMQGIDQHVRTDLTSMRSSVDTYPFWFVFVFAVLFAVFAVAIGQTMQKMRKA